MAYSLDKPLTEYSINQLVALYNDIARHNGTPTRSATFRNKATAIKAVQGQLVQANTADDDEPTPRLRKSPLADALRASVLADQAAAAETAADRPTTAKALVPATPPVARRGRTAGYTGHEIITVLVAQNPKRKGSAAHKHFAEYKTGQTIDQYGAAIRDRPQAIRNVRWDVKAGFIKLD